MSENGAEPRRRGRGEDGSASLQVVLVVPALLLAVTLVFQAMLYYHGRQAATLAAHAGLAVARSVDGSAAAGEARAGDTLAQLGHPLAQPSVSATRGPTVAQVAVTGRVQALVPWFPTAVHGTVSGPVARFEAGP
jgi:hypothetical protein